MSDRGQIRDILKKIAPVARAANLSEIKMMRALFELREPSKGDEYNQIGAKSAYSYIDRKIVSSVGFATETPHPDPDPTRVVHISADFQVEYTLDEGSEITDEQVRCFALVNGIYNAWPYWREFVQGAAAKMLLPTMLIPILRVDQAVAFAGVLEQSQDAESEEPAHLSG